MPKTQTELLREQIRKAHGFIRGMAKRADGYGSTFSEGVLVDCENFLRDNPTPTNRTHVVITRRYLGMLMDCTKERLYLKRDRRKLRFLISEVIATQAVTEACRDELRKALKS
jgi:hypothetical protein